MSPPTHTGNAPPHWVHVHGCIETPLQRARLPALSTAEGTSAGHAAERAAACSAAACVCVCRPQDLRDRTYYLSNGVIRVGGRRVATNAANFTKGDTVGCVLDADQVRPSLTASFPSSFASLP